MKKQQCDNGIFLISYPFVIAQSDYYCHIATTCFIRNDDIFYYCITTNKSVVRAAIVQLIELYD